MSTDIDKFVSDISAPDFAQVTQEVHDQVVRHAPGDTDRYPCEDCGECHVRRRLVCCVDGTWMLPDGTKGQFVITEPMSAIFRIYSSNLLSLGFISLHFYVM